MPCTTIVLQTLKGILTFNSLMPSHVKIISKKYKMMCRCEICILLKGMQNGLNVYRLIFIRNFIVKLVKKKRKQKQEQELTRIYFEKICIFSKLKTSMSHIRNVFLKRAKISKFEMNKHKKNEKNIIVMYHFIISQFKKGTVCTV